MYINMPNKKGRKLKPKNEKIKDIEDNNNDEVSFKILSKKVLRIQNNNIDRTTKIFIKNDGIVGLSVY